MQLLVRIGLLSKASITTNKATLKGDSEVGDREEILQLWIETESAFLGREIREGEDFDVERLPDRILVYYYGREQSEVEVLDITDTPLLH